MSTRITSKCTTTIDTPKRIMKPFYSGVFSQWYPSKFTIDDMTYSHAEQYMMAEKARLFKDYETLELIMKSKSPREQKRFGRIVKGFDPEIWKQHRFNIVVKGNLAKFEQNPRFKKKLLETEDQILCEASPYDKIWGIGLSIKDPKVKNRKMWKGLNLLGEALMQVRSTLRQNN